MAVTDAPAESKCESKSIARRVLTWTRWKSAAPCETGVLTGGYRSQVFPAGGCKFKDSPRPHCT